MVSKWIKQVTFMVLACIFIVGGGVTVLADSVPASIEQKYRGLVAPNVRSSLNIRKKASTNSSKVGTFRNGDIGRVISKGDNWTKIRSGSVTGYVANQYVLYGTDIYRYAKSHGFPRKATVAVGSLRLREKANRKSAALTSVSEGSKFKIYRQTPKWVKVKVNGKTGYLFKEYVDLGYYYTKADGIASESSGGSNSSGSSSSGTASQVVSYALNYVGNPYKYGGDSLTNGTDCSGFTHMVFGRYGYDIPRTASAQSSVGTRVSMSNLRKGDLLFYKNSKGKTNHVTIYMGNEQVVHASNSAPYPAGGIKVSSLYYRTPYKAMRIIS